MKDYDYLLKLTENNKIEFKTGKDKIPLSLYETFSSFSNTLGGTIYLGIEEENGIPKIVGINNAIQKKNQLANALLNKSKVSKNSFKESDINIISTENGDVIELIVNPVEKELKPVFLNGDPSLAYKRIDQDDLLLDEAEIKSLINDASFEKFDQKINAFKLNYNDLDANSVESFIEDVKAAGKITNANKLSKEEILAKVGALIRNPNNGELQLTNGAILFLGKSVDINSLLPNLWLDYQEIKDGNSRYNYRCHNKELESESNIYTFFKKVKNRLFDILPAPFTLVNGQEVGKLKMEETIREALANSISNLDLFSREGLIIKKYPNALSIVNAGTILIGLKQALVGGKSLPRNPNIMNYFLAMGISDHGGFGIPNIFENMELLNFSKPSLEEDIPDNETKLLLDLTVLKIQLTVEEQKAILYVNMHPDGITSFELANYLKCSKEKSRQLLNKLKENSFAKDNGKSSKGKKYFPI